MVSVTVDFVVGEDEVPEDRLGMYRQMADLFADGLQTFIEKNIDYGSSFQTAGQVDEILDTGEGPFEDAQEANAYKVFTRIQDKDQRFYNLVFCAADPHVDEAAAETAMDAAVYWFMMAWLLQHGDE